MMIHHNTKFGNKMFVGLEDIIWTNIDILAFAVTLILIAVIQFFHRTLQLMMQYYQTKSGCKWNSSLEDIAETVIFCLLNKQIKEANIKAAN